MFRRYILFGENLILKLEVILDIDTSAKLACQIYKITSKLPLSIIDSLKANPTSDSVFNSLNKELQKECFLSLVESTQLLAALKTNQFVNLTGYKIPSSELFNSFVMQFVTYYDIIRINLKPITQQEKIITNIETVTEIEQPEVDLITNIINNTEEVEIDSSIGFNLLQDIMKFSPNNITNLYISKLIMLDVELGLYYDKLSDFLKIEDKTITINITPLIVNNGLFSISYLKDINTCLSSFNFTQEEYLSKLRLLCKQLFYIIESVIINNDELNDSSKVSNIVLPIKVLQILIFIYSFKYTQTGNVTNINPNIIGSYICNISNHCIKFVSNKLQYNDYNIIFKYTELPLKIAPDYPEEIAEAISKYKYLIDIDRQSFLNLVFNDKQIKSKKSDILLINQSVVINIEKFINSKSNFLGYTVITDIDSQLKDHKIISKHYHDILKLSFLPTDMILDNLNGIDPIITKYSTIILDNIFKDLLTENFQSHPVSTIYLLEYFIKPYINIEDVSIETLLFILYQVVIPYIYDMFGVKEIIDYFH